jgi:hypothetical protein
MEQKMLRGIKQRAEAAPEQAQTLPGEQPG